jgi:hypothetical protein
MRRHRVVVAAGNEQAVADCGTASEHCRSDARDAALCCAAAGGPMRRRRAAGASRDQRQRRARHSLLPGEPARDGLSARRRPRGRAPGPRRSRRPSKRPATSAGPEPALVRACCVYGQGAGPSGASRSTANDTGPPCPTRRRSRRPRHLEAGESKPTWQPTTGTSPAPPLCDAERQERLRRAIAKAPGYGMEILPTPGT